MSFMIIMKIGQWCRNCKSRQYRDHIPGTVWWSHEYQREVITIYFILMNTILFSYSTKNDSLYFIWKKSHMMSWLLVMESFIYYFWKWWIKIGLVWTSEIWEWSVIMSATHFLIIRKWLTVILTLLTWYYRYCITVHQSTTLY